MYGIVATASGTCLPMALLRIAIGFCLAALVALLAVEAVAQSPPGAQPPPVERIAAGIAVAGQDVAGLTIQEAAAKL